MYRRVSLYIFIACLQNGCTSANRVLPTKRKQAVVTTQKIVSVRSRNDLEKKECFRDNPRDDHWEDGDDMNDNTCSSPHVPLDLFFRNPFCKKVPCSKRETCMLVAESALAYYGSAFDVVFLTGRMCQHKLMPGNLTRGMMQSMLPETERLVGLTLNGTDLVQALHQGIFENDKTSKEPAPTCSAPLPAFLQASSKSRRNQKLIDQSKKSKMDNFPTVAGVKFNVERNKATKRLWDFRVLSDRCEWPEIDLHSTYSILTTESLMFDDTYSSVLTRSLGYWNTGQTLQDVFWNQSTKSCVVQQPVPHNFPGNGMHKSAAKALGDDENELGRPSSMIRHTAGDIQWNVSQTARWIGATSR